MQFESLIPHLVASLSLLEAQINEWDRDRMDETLLPSEKEEFRCVRSVILEMRKTVNLFQLASAKGDIVESYRLIKIFYGLLWMSRPSIQKTQEILSRESGKDYSSRITTEDFDAILYNKENAH